MTLFCSSCRECCTHFGGGCLCFRDVNKAAQDQDDDASKTVGKPADDSIQVNTVLYYVVHSQTYGTRVQTQTRVQTRVHFCLTGTCFSGT